MVLIKIPRGWEIPESTATPEAIYQDRRRFLKTTSMAGMGVLAIGSGCRADELVWAPEFAHPESWKGLYPASRNKKFRLDRALTKERVAATYNNFYEFTTDKSLVDVLARKFPVYPWQVEVAGLVKKPKIFDIDELVRLVPLEERLYRHRCVEA